MTPDRKTPGFKFPACRAVRAAGLVLVLVVWGRAAQRVGDFSSLLANSPFEGRKPKVQQAAEPVLEFRGYVYTGGEALFNIVAAGGGDLHRNAWVEIGQPNEGCVVRSFDRDTDTLWVDYRGHELALRLKTNRVQLLVPERKTSVEEIAAAEGKEWRVKAARAILQDQARRVAEARGAQAGG